MTPRPLTSWICCALLTLATGSIVASRAQADVPARQWIDAEIEASWRTEKITPAPQADDSEFLRRVHLDLVGVIPTYKEVRQFLDDTSPDRRAKLVDRLLADPRYATHQAQVWDLVFFGRDPLNPSATRERDGFKTWLAQQFARKTVRYDELVRDLLTASKGGPQTFLVQFRNQTEEATVSISRLFLGTQLQCARCHDHPYEVWTQRDFYGMAGFFVRLVVLDKGGKGTDRYQIGEKSTGDVLFTGSVKDEQKPGQKGEPVKPRFLGGDKLAEPELPKNFKEPDWRKIKSNPPTPAYSRRQQITDWVVSPNNPYFARAIVNRMWGRLMGRGFIHPVDDLSENRKPSHPKLLDALAREMIAHDFDLKWLTREIVNSKAYQLASTGKVKDASPYFFERARVRPLSAEEIIASLRTAVGFDDALRASGKDPAKVRLGNSFEAYAMNYLGEPTNGLGDFQASLSEHLLFNNGVYSHITTSKGGLYDTLNTSKEPWPGKIDRMYLSVLTRLPSAAERDRFVSFVTEDPNNTGERIREAIWTLLNCAEFRFNH